MGDYNMLNKIFVGVRRDGSFEVHRSVFSPRKSRYKKLVQVEFENLFTPKLSFTCKVEKGIADIDGLWEFVGGWAQSHVLVNPKDIILSSDVYFIKDPHNTIAGNGAVVIVTGEGTIHADGSFQIVAYETIHVNRLTPARVDAWDSVTVSSENIREEEGVRIYDYQ